MEKRGLKERWRRVEREMCGEGMVEKANVGRKAVKDYLR